MMKQTKKMWIADQGDGTYKNPILYTDYSDPDAIRVGEDYFMIASSFCNSPAIPVLHSKDLVNWKVISYVLEKIPFKDYDEPAHGRGVWAPAIRYHEDTFYVFYPMPDEGIFMCTSKDPFKGWSEPVCVRSVIGWIDPCPFWDDDGKAYMVSAFARSRIGFKSILHMSSMEPDATGVLDDGIHVYDGNKTQPTIEGPKLYKRNGYYYIFAPAGGVKPGWQTVLRSKNIWGPYEEKIVLHQGNSPVNGPHQGAWIDTPTGEDWFLHFQDVGNAGRIVHLQPMRWEHDWPVIGVNDVDGCGEPVLHYKKPNVGGTYEIDAPEDSDYFEGEKLGLQWQWNANYQDEWYQLDTKEKKLNLYSVYSNTQLCDVKNLFMQKWPAPKFSIKATLDVSNLTEGDIAGMVSLGGVYSGLAVRLKDGVKKFVEITGEWLKKNETITEYDTLTNDQIIIKMNVFEDGNVNYEYSYDDISYKPVGTTIMMTPGRWVGVKAGLFCINQMSESKGYLTADSFVFYEAE